MIKKKYFKCENNYILFTNINYKNKINKYRILHYEKF